MPLILNTIWTDRPTGDHDGSYECFKVDVVDFVATVRLARPPVNAQNRLFREELITIFDALSDRSDVRAVV